MIFGYQTAFFNLDEEMNFPAYYQGVKLIAGGSIPVMAVLLRRLWIFLPLGLLLAYIGIDETAQIQPFFPQAVELMQVGIS